MPETDDTMPLGFMRVILFQIRKDTTTLKQWQMFPNLGRYSDFQKDVDRIKQTYFFFHNQLPKYYIVAFILFLDFSS